MKLLFILNDPPYGTERTYNALRLARNLAGREGNEIHLFLLGDAAASSHSGQKVPQGYYNVADMLSGIVRKGAAVGVCGTCMDARGIREEELVAGTMRGTMDQLAEWSIWADKVLIF